MRRYLSPGVHVQKVILLADRNIDQNGVITEGKIRVYHTPEAAAQWWAKFATMSWAWNVSEGNNPYPSQADKKNRIKKYQRRALPVFKRMFDAQP